jgi:hypothetical protein
VSKSAQTQAQTLAKTGKLTPSCTKDCKYGELMTEVPGGSSVIVAINITLQTWYEEGVTYDYKLEKPNPSTDEFTAIVWKGSKKMGVGVATRKTDGKIYIVFQFDPPGNIPGKFGENVQPSAGEPVFLKLWEAILIYTYFIKNNSSVNSLANRGHKLH